ncbi:rod shape-determining protein MreD [Halalkalibacillus sediminis]|uniref:rod shape-determining protein MreD n=1 Tax=Halalkalibacillus sediminis TaxID=2018042 RepID=UPI00138FADB6|nr:rod shape-determining protein MreD [Halalkalibacillus sediminis]
MKIYIIPGILFGLLVLESIATGLLPAPLLQLEVQYIPHWVLIFSILVLLFFDSPLSYHGIINGMIFALIIDLVYTDLLGVYFLAYAVTLYIIHLLKKLLHQNFYVAMLSVTLGLVIAECLIFGAYLLIGHINLDFNTYVESRLIPTVLINLLFFLIVYPLSVKWLSSWQKEKES